jgi:hypothetical protein
MPAALIIEPSRTKGIPGFAIRGLHPSHALSEDVTMSIVSRGSVR